MRTFLAATLALVLLTPYATAADDCERELVVGAGTTYLSIDNDLCQPECLLSFWVYQDDDPDPCNPEDEAPTIIF